MPDLTYPLGGQGVYEKQGGKELVVGSTGAITVESGGNVDVTGTLTAKSSGVLNVDSGGAITIDDGGHLAMPITTQSTTSGTITNFGLTTIGTTIASAYTLAAPTRPGLEKIIICTVHGATTVSQVVTTNSTAVTIVSSSNGSSIIRRTMTFTNGGQCVTLVSESTSAWLVTGNVSAVAFTS